MSRKRSDALSDNSSFSSREQQLDGLSQRSSASSSSTTVAATAAADDKSGKRLTLPISALLKKRSQQRKSDDVLAKASPITVGVAASVNAAASAVSVAAVEPEPSLIPESFVGPCWTLVVDGNNNDDNDNDVDPVERQALAEEYRMTSASHAFVAGRCLSVMGPESERQWNQTQLVRAQAQIRQWLAVRALHRERARELQRKLVALELLDTERKYVANIKLLVTGYRVALESVSSDEERGGLTDDDVNSIFLNVEDVAEANEQVQFALERRLMTEPWTPHTCIGDIFVKSAENFHVYAEYNAHFAPAAALIKTKREQSPLLDQFLENRRAELRELTSLAFDALHVMPIQRLPRYRLLLSQTRRYTPDQHPDAENLDRAITMVTELASMANESIRKRESGAKMRSVDKRVRGVPPRHHPLSGVAGRVYVREGPLMKVCKREQKIRWFFLFSDALVYAQRMPGDFDVFNFRKMFPLNSLSVVDVVDDEDRQLKNAFQIVAQEKSFTVLADDEHGKQDWMNQIQACCDAIELPVSSPSTVHDHQQQHLLPVLKLTATPPPLEHQSSDNDHDHDEEPAKTETATAAAAAAATSTLRSPRAPVWQPNRERDSCPICLQPFGIMRRKHHCRRCGQLICSSCSPHRVTEKSWGGSGKSRICNMCHERFYATSAASDSDSGSRRKISGAGDAQVQFEDLPEHVLIRVFEFVAWPTSSSRRRQWVGRCELVCHKWTAVLRAGALFPEINGLWRHLVAQTFTTTNEPVDSQTDYRQMMVTRCLRRQRQKTSGSPAVIELGDGGAVQTVSCLSLMGRHGDYMGVGLTAGKDELRLQLVRLQQHQQPSSLSAGAVVADRRIVVAGAGGVCCCAPVAGGTSLAVIAGNSNSVRLWNGDVDVLLDVAPAQSSMAATCLTSSLTETASPLLVVGHGNGLLQVLDPRTAQSPVVCQMRHGDKPGPLQSCSLDGVCLISCASNSLCLWDLRYASKRPVSSLLSAQSSLELVWGAWRNPRLVLAMSDGTVRSLHTAESTVRLWSSAALVNRAAAGPHTGVVFDCEWNRAVVARPGACCLQLFDFLLEQPQQQQQQYEVNVPGPVHSLCLTDSAIVVGSENCLFVV